MNVSPSNIPRTAILISTCEKYRALAELTHSRIKRLWSNHPPVFFAGLPETTSESLGFSGDSRDWMSVNHQAVVRLEEESFEFLYLILDDHPPLGVCHSVFLNHLLPVKLSARGGAVCNLLGYGQHRAADGTLLGEEDLWLEQTSDRYRWKFSLHPALWRVSALRELLELRLAQFQGRDRSPWKFERHADLPEDLPASLQHTCYRIHGDRWDAGACKMFRAFVQWQLQFGTDVALFMVRMARGSQVREAMSARWMWPYGLYRGPYPLFWSGIMRQGSWNPDLAHYLRFHPSAGLSRELAGLRSHS